jgi:acetyl-CoA synthetase
VLAGLLDVERFEPPPEFRENALLNDPEVYARARVTRRPGGPSRPSSCTGSRSGTHGYFWVIGRIDDVVNVSGHRLSTAEVESAIVAHVDVAEAAVIGQHDEDTGQAIVAFVTLQGELHGDDETVAGIRNTVAERIGKFARPKRIIWSDDLPKTRSGKIMRRLLRDIAEGRALGDVTTLRDPTVMSALQERINEHQAHED